MAAGEISPQPRAFFAFLFTERLSTTISEPGTGYTDGDLLFTSSEYNSSSIKIGIDLSLHKSIKIGKSDLIDIDCIDLACVASVSVLFPSKDRALVSFLGRPKPRISFLGLSLLRNSTETLATQASIDQLVEIDDTLVSYIDLSRFYRFHPFISEDTSKCSPVHPKMKTAFMQTVNLLTIE